VKIKIDILLWNRTQICPVRVLAKKVPEAFHLTEKREKSSLGLKEPLFANFWHAEVRWVGNWGRTLHLGTRQKGLGFRLK
jgi:hypothetical protein